MSRAERRLAVTGAMAVLLVAGGCQILTGIEAREVRARDAGADAAVEPDDRGDAADAAPDGGSGCRLGEDRCGDTCIDLRTDRRNCGECGHSCLDQGCTNGVCDPNLWLQGTVTGAVWLSGEEILFRPDPDPGVIPGTPVLSLLRAKHGKTGATRSIVDVGYYLAMAPIGGSSWLVLEHVPGARVRKLDVVTKEWSVLHAEPLQDPAIRGAAVDGDDVYWTTREDVRHVKLDGSDYGIVHVRAGGGAPHTGVYVTPSRTYFGVESSGLWALDRTTGASRAVDAPDGGSAARWIGVFGTELMWLASKELRSFPLPAETPQTAQNLQVTAGAISAVARDGFVWIADVGFQEGKPDAGGPRSRVLRYDTRTRKILVLVANFHEMGQIAVDDTYVYMPAFGQGIWRVPR